MTAGSRPTHRDSRRLRTGRYGGNATCNGRVWSTASDRACDDGSPRSNDHDGAVSMIALGRGHANTSGTSSNGSLDHGAEYVAKWGPIGATAATGTGLESGRGRTTTRHRRGIYPWPYLFDARLSFRTSGHARGSKGGGTRGRGGVC